MMRSKIQSLVENAFEVMGDLSDRMWAEVQSALESDKPAKEQARPDYTHSEEEDGESEENGGGQGSKEQALATGYTHSEEEDRVQGSKEQAPAIGETKEVIPPTQNISRGGRIRKMSTRKAK